MKQKLHINEIKEEFQLPSFKNVLILTSNGHVERGNIEKLINTYKVQKFTLETLHPFPTINHIRAIREKHYKKNFDLIISLGGGSVIDVAKSLSVLLINEYIFNNLFNSKNVSEIREIENIEFIKHLAIPTTSGSGAEATSFATIWDFELKQKYSLENISIMPSDVLLDSSFLLSLNYENTLHPGLDAICHSFDSLVNKFSTKQSIKYSINSLETFNCYFFDLLQNLNSYELREKIHYASYQGGCSININKTSITHALSYPLTLNYNVPHGLACAVFIKPVFDEYYEKLENEESFKILSELVENTEKLDLISNLKTYTKHINSNIYNKESINQRIDNFKYELDSLSLSRIIEKVNL